MYYSSIGMLSIVLLLIINADTMFGKRGEDLHAHISKYRKFLFASLLYFFADTLWGVLLDVGIVPLVYADTVLYFLSMGLCVLTWVRYIAVFLNMNKTWRTALTTIGLAILGSEIVVLTINLFVPIMFSFTEDGEYVASPARYAILYVQLFMFFVVAVDTLVTSRKLKVHKRYHHLAIGISGFIMAVFVYLQAQYPLMPFYAVGNLIATCIINSFVVVEERVESSHMIGSIMTVAYKDTLTNVRNNNAYSEYKEVIGNDIRHGLIKEFAVVVFDLNDLKRVNDNDGHEAGDKYIKDGCMLICKTFEHSPVFRIGGDEFVAFLVNDDYRNRDALMDAFNARVDQNNKTGGVIVSAGISQFDPATDTGYDDVFVRADELMYERKKELKTRKN